MTAWTRFNIVVHRNSFKKSVKKCCKLFSKSKYSFQFATPDTGSLPTLFWAGGDFVPQYCAPPPLMGFLDPEFELYPNILIPLIHFSNARYLLSYPDWITLRLKDRNVIKIEIRNVQKQKCFVGRRTVKHFSYRTYLCRSTLAHFLRRNIFVGHIFYLS